jgi:hypothetical protein
MSRPVEIGGCVSCAIILPSVVPGLNVVSGLIGVVYHLALLIINNVRQSNDDNKSQYIQPIKNACLGLKQSFILMIPIVGNIVAISMICCSSPAST